MICADEFMRRLGAIPEERVLIDVETSDLTMAEVMRFVRDYQAAHPDEELFLDGDRYAVMVRQRVVG